MKGLGAPAMLGLLMVGCVATGCVRRTITITTAPPAAMVWLNDREIGRSPVSVDFDYYGTYDVRLQHADYEPMMTSGEAKAPLWDTVGLDLVAEILPFTLHSRVEWHYVLEPSREDPEALVGRARRLRSQIPTPEADQPPPPSAPDDQTRP
jgi:hypothetical protein